MKFFRLFVNNKVVVYIFTIIIVLAGISAYTSLPRESSPSIEIPYVFISTLYIGVSPEEIEKLEGKKEKQTLFLRYNETTTLCILLKQCGSPALASHLLGI